MAGSREAETGSHSFHLVSHVLSRSPYCFRWSLVSEKSIDNLAERKEKEGMKLRR